MTESKRIASKETSAEITSDDILFLCEKCTDFHGKKHRSTLAVDEEKRAQFYLQHPLIEIELLKEPKNPPLEEGHFSSLNIRDKKGELFITYPVAAMLLKEEIIEHTPKPGGLPYNTENMFMLKDDLDELSKRLQRLNLQPDEDAKIGFFFDIHEIEMYLRNIDGEMHVFIIDPLGFEDDNGRENRDLLALMRILQKVFADAFIVVSRAELQLDYFSCSVDGHMILRFFAKHGAKVFSHIKEHGTTKKRSEDGSFFWYLLEPKDLMPALYKVSLNRHYNQTLTENLQKTIVSVRKKITVQEYLDQSIIPISLRGVGDTEFYAQSLLKRYKYIAKADLILVRNLKKQFLQETEIKDIPDAFRDMIRINIFDLTKLLEQNVSPTLIMSFCHFLYENGYPVFHRLAAHPHNATLLVNFAVNLKEHGTEFLALENNFGRSLLKVLANSPQTETIDVFAKLPLPEETAHAFFLSAVTMTAATRKQNRLYLIKTALQYYHDPLLRQQFINNLINTYPAHSLNDAQKEEIQFLLQSCRDEERTQVFLKLLKKTDLLAQSVKEDTQRCVSLDEIRAFLLEQKSEQVRPLLMTDVIYETYKLNEDQCKKLFSLYQKFLTNAEIRTMLFYPDLSHTRWLGWALSKSNAFAVKMAIELCRDDARAKQMVDGYLAERFASNVEHNETTHIDFFFTNNLVSKEMLALAAKKCNLARHPYFAEKQGLLNPLLDEGKSLPQQSLLGQSSSSLTKALQAARQQNQDSKKRLS